MQDLLTTVKPHLLDLLLSIKVLAEKMEFIESIKVIKIFNKISKSTPFLSNTS